jgi:protein-S-isoprenylcysteine O-methyltransferase Ste14
MDLRQRIFEYRSYTPFPFLIAMLIWAQPTILSIAAGLCVVLTGEFIRLWGVAFAGSETRTTGPVGGTYLITRGPFAYVRNPLYVGNILIYSGVGVMAHVLWLFLAALVYFVWQYSQIISLEEEYLQKAFGDKFTEYCREVPRFIPNFRKYPGGHDDQPGIDWKSGLQSERRTLQAVGLSLTVMIVIWFLKS